MADDKKSLMEFPCDFPIKVMGKNTSEFESAVVGIMQKHVPDLGEGAFEFRPSRDKNYMSITVTFIAQSQQQLDNIYQALTEEKTVLMAF